MMNSPPVHNRIKRIPYETQSGFHSFLRSSVFDFDVRHINFPLSFIPMDRSRIVMPGVIASSGNYIAK